MWIAGSCRWGDNIKTHPRNIRCECVDEINWHSVGSSGWFFEHNNEPSDSIKGWEFLSNLGNYQTLYQGKYYLSFIRNIPMYFVAFVMNC
jgi:hypothetical protein